MAYIYNLTDTWNAAGTTFSSIKMVVTNTASASGSALLDLSVSGATTGSFVVDKNANLTLSGKINKYTFTSPASGATIALADGSTLATAGAYSLTLTTTGATNITLPTSGTLTTTSNNLGVFASTTSSQLAGVISDETGSGSLVFATSPTLVTPNLGTPSAVTLTNATGLPVGGISATGTPSSSTYLRGDGSWSTVSGSMVYPGAGIPNSTGSAWGTSYSTTGSGTVVALSTAPTFGTNITVGTAGSSTGIVNLKGTTSGTVSLSVADAAGTWTMKLPTSAGTSGYYLQTDGLGNTVWAAGGGGGGGSPGGSNTQVQYNNAGAFGGAAGFTFNGTDTVGVGVASTTTGLFKLYNSLSANAVTVQSGNNGSAWTLTLPTSAGTNNYVLSTDGTGATSWVAAATGTVTSVGGTGTVNGLTLTGTVTTSGNLTLGGTLSVSSSDISGTISVAKGGTGLSSGTSGGVLYYSATGTLASSAALAANALVVGGGAGVAPSTVTTGTGVVTALGVNTGSAGAFVVNGGALGTPASGTLTSCTGLPLTMGVTGVLPVANGGTNASVAGITAFNNITGYTATGATGTTSTNLVFSTSPTLVTPTLGVASATSINKVAITAPATGSTLTIADGKTLTASNSLTLAGTDSTTMTFPSSSATIAGLGVTQSFTGTQTFAGTSSVLAAVFNNTAEVATVSATAATGTINYDTSTQSVIYYTSDASANWTVNFRHSSGTSLNTAMATGQSVTVAFLVTQGATAYYNSAVTIDGNAVTPKWQGGTAPTAGNASGVDIYAYTIVKTGSATFTVFASQTQFK